MYQQPMRGPEMIEHLKGIVGVLNSERVFVSYRRPEHIFRKFNGLGISYSVLQKLKARNCRRIVLILQKENGTQEQYNSTVEQFLEEGKWWADKVNDNQRILPFACMNQKKLTEVLP